MGGSASRRRRMFLSHARFIDLENAGENGDARTKWVRGCLLRPLNISREKVENGVVLYNHSWRPRVRALWGLGRLEEKLRHESNEERKGKKRRNTERGREPDGGCVRGTDCLCVDGGRLAREGGRRGRLIDCEGGKDAGKISGRVLILSYDRREGGPGGREGGSAGSKPRALQGCSGRRLSLRF